MPLKLGYNQTVRPNLNVICFLHSARENNDI